MDVAGSRRPALRRAPGLGRAHLRRHRERHRVRPLGHERRRGMVEPHVGTPVPSGSLPCGNISPNVGITGTPVIDEARSELFVVADELVNGSPAHELVGLSTATGKTEMTQGVDPVGSTPAALLQRTGLTLDAGRVVFGYGGNYGDCGSYHGWVLSVPEAGGTPAAFAVDSANGESRGAIWMGGAAPGGRRERQRLGHRRQRLGGVGQSRLRQQRLRARALAVAAPCCSTSPRPRGPPTTPPTSTSPPRPRCWPTGRWWRPASRGSCTCSTGPPSVASAARKHRCRPGAATTSTAASPSWDHRLPPVPERHHRRAGIGVPGRAPSAVELLGGRRTPHRGRRAGLDDRAER